MPDIQLTFWDVLTTSGFTALGSAVLIYLFKGPVSGFLTRAVARHFDEKLTEFKFLLSTAAMEREKISAHILEGRQGRDTVLNSKRLEAAETLYRELERTDKLFSGVVSSIKVLNVDHIRNDASAEDAQKIQETLEYMHNLGEKAHKVFPDSLVLPELYLDDDITKLFRTYNLIHLHANMILSTLGLQKEAERYFTFGHLRNEVETLYPVTKEGFEKIGESFAYEYLPTIKSDLLNRLREVTGFKGQTAEDHRIAIDVMTRAQNIPDTLIRLKEGGVSKDFLVNPENRPA